LRVLRRLDGDTTWSGKPKLERYRHCSKRTPSGDPVHGTRVVNYLKLERPALDEVTELAESGPIPCFTAALTTPKRIAEAIATARRNSTPPTVEFMNLASAIATAVILGQIKMLADLEAARPVWNAGCEPRDRRASGGHPAHEQQRAINALKTYS
jgi:hypothetical protein